MAEPTTPNPETTRPRVVLLVNRGKEPVAEALASFVPWLEARTDVVGVLGTEENASTDGAELPDADLAMILGGDGTFLSQARVLVDRGIPTLGVNFGKVGFLAEWEIDHVKRHWDTIACGGCRRTQRIMIDVDVFPEGADPYAVQNGSGHQRLHRYLAMNDAVIAAGPPYRMIEFEVAIEPAAVRRPAVTVAGDGLIVATPSGSTAYNLSAGGPIVSPGVPALMLSAISPYTLAFRPIVFGSECDVWIKLTRANAGTALVVDGQPAVPLREGQHVRVIKHPKMLTLIQNPELTYWSMLSHKMRWAVRPRRD
ncbi:MAG: NAD(+)/NADH kinase [Planctomycetota bacterium]